MSRVVSIEIIESDDPIDVFDIEVEHDHSFIVHGVVLHNSQICRSYSGKAWTLDGKPINHSLPYNGGVPRHFRCRSVEVPLLRDIDDITTGKANNLPESTQASMDGQVPADLDFSDWLRTKPKSFQMEILGPTKWELWSSGKVTMADMLDFTGRPLTVAELREKYGG